METILFDDKIFTKDLTLKALAIYITRRYLKKQDQIDPFVVRKEFKNGKTSIKSGIEKLEKANLISKIDEEKYKINTEILNDKNSKLIYSKIFKENKFKLGEIGMYILLQYLALKEGKINKEFNCIRSKNFSIEELSNLLTNDGDYSIRNKTNKLIENNYFSKYPIYINGEVKTWRTILNTNFTKYRVINASKRINPDSNFIKRLNKRTENEIKDPSLKFEKIYYVKVHDIKDKEEKIYILKNEDIDKYKFIYE